MAGRQGAWWAVPTLNCFFYFFGSVGLRHRRLVDRDFEWIGQNKGQPELAAEFPDAGLATLIAVDRWIDVWTYDVLIGIHFSIRTYAISVPNPPVKICPQMPSLPFDAVADPARNSVVGFAQSMQVRTFIVPRIIPVTMGRNVSEKAASNNRPAPVGL